MGSPNLEEFRVAGGCKIIILPITDGAIQPVCVCVCGGGQGWGGGTDGSTFSFTLTSLLLIYSTTISSPPTFKTMLKQSGKDVFIFDRECF